MYNEISGQIIDTVSKKCDFFEKGNRINFMNVKLVHTNIINQISNLNS